MRTITRDDFRNASVVATEDEAVKKILKEIPSLLLLLVMYSHKMENALFKGENDGN